MFITPLALEHRKIIKLYKLENVFRHFFPGESHRFQNTSIKIANFSPIVPRAISKSLKTIRLLS